MEVHHAWESQQAHLESCWYNRHGLVHVLHTKLLQHHVRLRDSTLARWYQFQTFTVPSILGQTNAEFLWIIWTDPRLTPSTEQALHEWLRHLQEEQQDNESSIVHKIVMIAYKKQCHDIRSPWFQDTFDPSYMIAGSYKLLMNYHHAVVAQSSSTNHSGSSSSSRSIATAVLETVLDADHALATNYVQLVQEEAVQAFSLSPDSSHAQHPAPKIRFWCPSQLVDWEYFVPSWLPKEDPLVEEQQPHVVQEGTMDGAKRSRGLRSQEEPTEPPLEGKDNKDPLLKERGYFHFSATQSRDKCLSSAGTTIGYAPPSTTLEQHFSLFAQERGATAWHETIPLCDDTNEANCLGFLTRARDPQQQLHGHGGDSLEDEVAQAMVLRSTTITGAPTKSIFTKFPPPPSVTQAVQLQHIMWNHLHLQFAIVPESVRSFRYQFQRHLDAILLDMLTICLPSTNACKPQSRQTLQELLVMVGLKPLRNPSLARTRKSDKQAFIQD